MDARKDTVLALTGQILRETVDEYKGMEIHKVREMYDSVDIFLGVGKINVCIAYDSPLAIFKDIAAAIPCEVTLRVRTMFRHGALGKVAQR